MCSDWVIMIQKIKIENFKSLQSLTVELGRVNVFIGENGSGKSNILEAIAMGSAAAENKLDNEFLSTRGIRTTDPKAMRSGFLKENAEQNIKMKFTDEEDSSEIELANINNPYPHYPQWELINVPTTEHLSDFNLKRLFFTNNDSVKKFRIYAPENHFLRKFEDEEQIFPLGKRGEGLFKLIAELQENNPKQFEKIKTHLELIDWFGGFEVPNNLKFTERRISIKDRFLDEGLGYFDQRSSNEGFLFLLFYFSLFISDYTPHFFAIDNIDNSLNPKLCAELIKTLVKLAKEHNKQVILTTHNPAILDGLNLNDDEQRLFVVYRNTEGHTKTKRVLPKPIAEGSMPVKLSEQFLRGYIGGLPNNF